MLKNAKSLFSFDTRAVYTLRSFFVHNEQCAVKVHITRNIPMNANVGESGVDDDIERGYSILRMQNLEKRKKGKEQNIFFSFNPMYIWIK